MSRLSNCILSFSISEDEEKRIKDVNEFFVQYKQNGFISADDPELPSGWYGGSKMLETPLYIAAINWFVEDEFIDHLRKIKWECPESVQLIIKRQDEDQFSIVTLNEKGGEDED